MNDNQQRFFIIGLIAAAVFICAGAVAASIYLTRRLITTDTITLTEYDDVRSLTEAQGVLVTNVQPDSPAWNGGVRRGDIILRLDDRVISDTADLQQAVQAAGPETAVMLTLRTGSNIRHLPLTLAPQPPLLGLDVIDNRPATDPPASPTVDADTTTPDPRPPAAGQPGAGLRRALVDGIVPDSAAAAAGLQPGDIIIAIDDAAILNGRELMEFMEARQAGEPLTVMLRRGPDTLFVEVVLGPHPDDPTQGYLGVELPPGPGQN